MQQLTDFWNSRNGKIIILGGVGATGFMGLCVVCAFCSIFFYFINSDSDVTQVSRESPSTSVELATEPEEIFEPAEAIEPEVAQPIPTPIPEATPTPEPPPTAEQPSTFAVGDVVNAGDSTLVVIGWQDVPPNDFAQPDPGNKFIAIELVIVNQSSSPVSLSSLLQTKVKDADARQYDPDLLASTATDSSGIEGELAPGERVRGKVGFQVPETISGLQFVYDDNIFGTGKVTVNLGDTPITVEPPAEIAGETSQEIFALGDVVEVGNLSLTVHSAEEIAGNDFAKPDEGNRFLIVDVTVENRGSEPAGISTLLQMALKDNTGQKYDIDLLAQTAAQGSSVDGELAAGEKIRGPVGFQVPNNASGLVFEFDGTVFGFGKVQVALE